ncbi:MAG: hypothetical protein Q4F67_05310 [Propionibacteriaceae bacterium]|nr:hypothetical protein [Propionibacteriaceae bacterium]
MKELSGAHVFADESKRGSYLLVAVPFAAHDRQRARKRIRSLIHPGSSDIHMKREGDAHRKRILGGLSELGITAIVIESRAGRDRVDRRGCLAALYRRLHDDAAGRLVLETDESLLKWDRQTMFQIAAEVGHPQLEYGWCPRRAEPLLWTADAVAWCYARGGSWRRDVQRLIGEVMQV